MRDSGPLVRQKLSVASVLLLTSTTADVISYITTTADATDYGGVDDLTRHNNPPTLFNKHSHVGNLQKSVPTWLFQVKRAMSW